MKRKSAKRKTTKKKPGLTAKPLRELGGEVLRNLPARWEPHTGSFWGVRQRTEVNGVPLPPDLEDAIAYYARNEVRNLASQLRSGISRPMCDHDGNEEEVEIAPPLALAGEHVEEILDCVEGGMWKAFSLALLRYADDLKRSAEAAPLIEGLREAARKGGAARRAKAEPIHKAIRKRFRELRKTTPKKTVRYMRVAEEFEITDRHVARIVDGID
jgi:hypothetical protein